MLEGSASDDELEQPEEIVGGRRADSGGNAHSVESVDQEPERPESPTVHTRQEPRDEPGLGLDPSMLAADLYNLERILLTNVLSFTLLDRNLRFVNDPTTSGDFVRYVTGSRIPYNTGRCALLSSHPVNRRFIAYHTWLMMTHTYLASEIAGAEEARLHAVERLRDKFMEEIDRLEDIKEAEWDYQQLKPVVDEDDAPYRVDTGQLI